MVIVILKTVNQNKSSLNLFGTIVKHILKDVVTLKTKF